MYSGNLTGISVGLQGNSIIVATENETDTKEHDRTEKRKSQEERKISGLIIEARSKKSQLPCIEEVAEE